jgi:hypothetical protein
MLAYNQRRFDREAQLDAGPDAQAPSQEGAGS